MQHRLNGKERGHPGFSFKAENTDLKARLERLERMIGGFAISTKIE